jgi:exodeoxyribonuclease-3
MTLTPPASLASSSGASAAVRAEVPPCGESPVPTVVSVKPDEEAAVESWPAGTPRRAVPWSAAPAPPADALSGPLTTVPAGTPPVPEPRPSEACTAAERAAVGGSPVTRGLGAAGVDATATGPAGAYCAGAGTVPAAGVWAGGCGCGAGSFGTTGSDGSFSFGGDGGVIFGGSPVGASTGAGAGAIFVGCEDEASGSSAGRTAAATPAADAAAGDAAGCADAPTPAPEDFAAGTAAGVGIAGTARAPTAGNETAGTGTAAGTGRTPAAEDATGRTDRPAAAWANAGSNSDASSAPPPKRSSRRARAVLGIVGDCCEALTMIVYWYPFWGMKSRCGGLFDGDRSRAPAALRFEASVMDQLRIATWNVNSLAARMPRVTGWLAQTAPDVLCLQETKATEASFPTEELAALGYQSAADGDGAYNGVAILSRVGLEDVTRGFADEPGFPDPERRSIAATCGGLRVWSVYVPNGRTLDSAHYAYKLEWLRALTVSVEQELAGGTPLAVCGDFNVAPTDADVWDPTAFVGSTHVSAPEREAIRTLLATGLTDVQPRALKGQPYTYWDYRAGMFHKGEGMRIDLVLLSRAVAAAVSDAYIDRDARKGSKPSDHAPVVVDLNMPA